MKDDFMCATYRKGTAGRRGCTSHSITLEAIEKIVLTDLQRVLSMAKANEKEFAELLRTSKSKETKRDLSSKTKEYEEAEKTDGKKRQIVEIYYNCVGVIPNPA